MELLKIKQKAWIEVSGWSLGLPDLQEIEWTNLRM